MTVNLERGGDHTAGGPAETPLARRGALPVTAGLAVLLLAAMTLSISFGPIAIAPPMVWLIVLHHLVGLGDPSGWTGIQDNIVWQLRFPRTLLSALVGAGLATVGVTVQALVRNPLADPYLLGISSGASVGAVLVLVTGVSILGLATTSGAAFLGALVAFGLVYLFATRAGTLVPLRLVLAGVAIGYAMSGVTSYLVLQASNPGVTSSVLFWLLGSMAAARWSDLGLPGLTVAVGIVLLMARARAMNALVVGDETASSLGVNVDRVRRELFVVASMVTGVMVALTGSIGFVGLVVPHAVRMTTGSDHRRLLPAAAIGGATFMVVADLVARVVLSPEELPIGIVTALVGTPVFLWLMHRRLLPRPGQ
jgi:iron complex transport system permease protein